ncbi:CAP domain-containing protein [Aspergillus pseudotamarii]|uniref:CAP domain-containing protein n=1 Tax=Aspergillus pseudotamarii TaxID=132259 RepID=A0A5N6SYV3_ASPPS|nr:CAP domain-containing protein [Aspergillus pseudotamarii]KAE8139845.1 CAP domain-containing protein [Aspergillus pseudotamarii]
MKSPFSFAMLTLLCFSGAQATFTEADKQRAVSLHNNHRSSVMPSASNMKSIEWDEGLATAAQQLADSCKFEHNRAGQNIYEGSDATDLLKQAIEAWHNEQKDYNYDSNTCSPNAVCGHYTQVVWADSSKVGMGVSRRCENGMYIVVANYDPVGNYAGEKPYRQR